MPNDTTPNQTVPPQSTTLHDPRSPNNAGENDIFNKPWWMFFNWIFKQIGLLWDAINAIIPGTTASYISDLGVLSSGPTNITSPVATPNEGDQLTVFWQQPAAGLEQITWDAIFQLVTPNDNDQRPNRYNSFSFKAKADNLWWPVGFLMGRQ